MKRLLFVLLVPVLSFVHPITAPADRGDDHDNSQGVPFEDIQTCVQSCGGFNPDFSLRLLQPECNLFNHATIQNNGFSVRNPDGTRTDTFRSTFITFEATPFTTPPGTPVIVSEGSCTGPVETLPDGSLLFTYTCTGQNIAGFGTGDTFVTTGGATLSRVGKRGQVVYNTNPVPPRIETVHITRVPDEMGNVVEFDFQRVCTRAGVGELLRAPEHTKESGRED